MKLSKMAKERECTMLLVSVFLFASGTWAADAIWTGGASGCLNDAANWDGSTASGEMMFANDCTVSLSSDLTVNSVFTANMPGIDYTDRFGRNITINLNGHTLGPEAA